jgi:PhnB protein
MKGSFGGQEVIRMPAPGGKIEHAEVKIGDSIVTLSDAVAQSPNVRSLFLYVNDVDTTHQRAVRAGATSLS